MLHSGSDIELLLQDDDFIRWVISPDKTSAAYWETWQQQDPIRKETLQNAKRVVLSVYNQERLLVDQLLNKDLTRSAWEEISRHMQKAAPKKASTAVSRWMYFAAAASVVSIAILVFFLSRSGPEKLIVSDNKEKVRTANPHSADIQFNNNANGLRLINLPDGSRVVLSKNSSFRYNRLFNADKREVYLTGNAFFEVAKDAKRPFYVYSGNVVTKVLGTSFRVISDDINGRVTVAVRSGKVKVFRQNDAQHEKTQYFLVRNEQLVFTDKETRPVKVSIQEDIIPVSEIPAPLNFSFDEASLADIVSALEKSYNVEIEYDKTTNELCRVTVALDGNSLYDKLDLLCKVISATYHTNGSRIYLDGKGCN